MSTEKAAEKEISAAIETMVSELANVLRAQGIDPKDNQTFDLTEHGILDEHGKVRHSDSQKILLDPKALSDYQTRSAKALWNFAVSLKQILGGKDFGDKAKVGLRLKSFITENIRYLDSRHLDEFGKPKKKIKKNKKVDESGSYSNIIVDSNTLALARIYHQFLVTVIANKEGLFGMLPGAVKLLIGSVLQSAIKAAGKITKRLEVRESEFEKKRDTYIATATSTLNKHEQFFLAALKIESDWSELDKNVKATPEKRLEFIKTSRDQLSHLKADKESLALDIETITTSLEDIANRPLAELELDPKEIIASLERIIQRLRDYQRHFDQTLEQHQALLSRLNQHEELIVAEMNAAQRTTPMEQRPAALRAALVELNNQKKIVEDNQTIQSEINEITLLSPLKLFVETVHQREFPFDQAELTKLMALLKIDTTEEKKFSLLSDNKVFFEDTKMKRQEALSEFVELAKARLGSFAYKDSEYLSKIRELRGTTPATLEDSQRIDSEITSLTEQLNSTVQQESNKYRRQVEPMLLSANRIVTLYDTGLKEKNIPECDHLQTEAQQTLSAIEQFNTDYDDCELDKTQPQLTAQITQLRSKLSGFHQQLELTKTKIAQDNADLVQREQLFIRYFGENGKGTQYLSNREKKYKGLDVFQRNFGFFRKSGAETEAEKRALFLSKLGNDIINYVDSGDKQYLVKAIEKIDDAIETKQFPHRRSPNDYANSMQSLLESLKTDLVSEQQKGAQILNVEPPHEAQLSI